jgi:hypothetical protein
VWQTVGDRERSAVDQRSRSVVDQQLILPETKPIVHGWGGNANATDVFTGLNRMTSTWWHIEEQI